MSTVQLDVGYGRCHFSILMNLMAWNELYLKQKSPKHSEVTAKVIQQKYETVQLYTQAAVVCMFQLSQLCVCCYTWTMATHFRLCHSAYKLTSLPCVFVSLCDEEPVLYVCTRILWTGALTVDKQLELELEVLARHDVHYFQQPGKRLLDHFY